jgi:hypothetical protein
MVLLLGMKVQLEWQTALPILWFSLAPYHSHEQLQELIITLQQKE